MVDATLELWAADTVCKKTSLSRTSLYRMIREGSFPKARRVGVNRSAWWSTEVIAWMAALPPADEAVAA